MIAPAYTYTDGLESERLLTRFLKKEDVETWRSFFKDKEAIELFPPSMLVAGEDHALNWINRQMQRYQEKNYGLQALIDKSTCGLIGQCGLLRQQVDGKEELEVGYHIVKEHWGKGYAPEAAKLFLNYAFANTYATSVISIIDVRNIKSQRVAEKNGLMPEKQTHWNGLDVYIYRIHKPGTL